MYGPCKAKTSRVFPTAAGALLSFSRDTSTFATSTLVIRPTATSPWLNIGLRKEKKKEKKREEKRKNMRGRDNIYNYKK